METTTDKPRRGGSKKGTSSPSSSKRARKGNGKGNGHAGAEDNGFTAGSENTNIRRLDEHPSAGKGKKKQTQPRLPGTEDEKIKLLHNTALEYKALRDEMQTAVRLFKEKKTQLIDLMHAHKKEAYQCEGVKVMITHAQENVKVELDVDSDEEMESEN
jgi:hypothetical protein